MRNRRRFERQEISSQRRLADRVRQQPCPHSDDDLPCFECLIDSTGGVDHD